LAALRSVERQTFTADGIQGVALRYGLVYGDDPATRTLVALLRQGRLALPTDGGGIMSWIYLDDVVVATVAALERNRPGQAYNLVDDEPVRWRDFLGTLARAGQRTMSTLSPSHATRRSSRDGAAGSYLSASSSSLRIATARPSPIVVYRLSSGSAEADSGLVGKTGDPFGPQHHRELGQHA
jgi:nucleoside-diphosphate-sugar epimerase